MTNATHKDAKTLIEYVDRQPALIILTRRNWTGSGGEMHPGGPVPFLSNTRPEGVYAAASEHLAEWAKTIRSFDHVIAELWFAHNVGDADVTLQVPLRTAHVASGFDLRLALKRFAQRVAEVAATDATSPTLFAWKG